MIAPWFLAFIAQSVICIDWNGFVRLRRIHKNFYLLLIWFLSLRWKWCSLIYVAYGFLLELLKMNVTPFHLVFLLLLLHRQMKLKVLCKQNGNGTFGAPQIEIRHQILCGKMRNSLSRISAQHQNCCVGSSHSLMRWYRMYVCVLHVQNVWLKIDKHFTASKITFAFVSMA